MMQRTIGTYIANKVKDEIFKPTDMVEDDAGDEVHYVEQMSDALHGELIRDSSGAVLGRAYRVPAAIYVVAANDADVHAALERTLNDPEHETILHWDGSEIGALVFVSGDVRANAESGPRGFRADDV
ncbi:MAG: hypothetical protein KC435_09815 [Thermomicrobiales bacterium]|nr:hypothetical protein [Thermomicrobiales bacterium]